MECRLACTAAGVAQALREFAPQVVVSDLNLPGFSGAEALALTRAHDPDLPFVFPLFLGMQSRSYIAATDAIVEPTGEQRDEATMYTQLARACGVSGSCSLPLVMRNCSVIASAVSNSARS